MYAPRTGPSPLREAARRSGLGPAVALPILLPFLKVPGILLRNLLLTVVAVLALAGCAAQQIYREGETLIENGDFDKGMERFQEALRLEPTNARFRSTYLVTRERAMNGWMESAARVAGAGDAMAAEAWYRRVLLMEPGHPRALAGLAQLEQAKRHASAYSEARRLLTAGEPEKSLYLLREILSEDPANRRAIALAHEIDVKLAKPVSDPELSAGLKKPITIEFKDTPIRQVFEIFSRTSGLNFVFDRDVRGDLRATIFFRNSTVEAAMKILLLTNQLEYKVLDANSVLIYPNTPAKVREYQTLVGKVFFLNNADAKQVVNTIKAIVKTRDIVADEKQNMIIMRDSPEALRIAERLVAMHDLADPEVMLEVEILEVKRSKLLELGIIWPSQLVLTPLASATGGVVTLNDLRNISGSRVGANIGTLTLNANRTAGDTNLLANPRIRSKNKEKARIMVGDKVPNITTTSTSTGFVSETVQYIDVGLKLEVEPTIYPDDEIALKIALEVSSVTNQVKTASGTVAYQIGTRNANAVLRLKDGENQVLAGLISDEDRSTANRVPALGDVPILGRLFGSQRDQKDKTEIVLSITPRLIRNMRRPSLDETEFFTGTEASLRNRGVDPAQVAVAPGQFTSGIPLPANAVPGAAPQAPAAGTSLTLQGPPQVRVGGTFTVQLNMQAGEPVASVPVSLSYDARMLDVVSVSEGSLLRQNGGRTTFTSRVDRGTGQIFATVARTDDGGNAGAGSIVAVVFRALAPSPDVRTQVTTVSAVAVGGKAIETSLPAFHSVIIVP